VQRYALHNRAFFRLERLRSLKVAECFSTLRLTRQRVPLGQIRVDHIERLIAAGVVGLGHLDAAQFVDGAVEVAARERVPPVLVGDSQRALIGGQPIVVVSRFLDHLAERSWSPHTLCAYGYDLQQLFTFLASEQLAWHAFEPADALRLLAFLGGAFGIALSATVFAASGGFGSAQLFSAGFSSAIRCIGGSLARRCRGRGPYARAAARQVASVTGSQLIPLMKFERSRCGRPSS
jgi:Phage integrase, N-terminal SAM-like domain